MIHFKFGPISFIRTASIVKFHFPKHIFMNIGYRVGEAKLELETLITGDNQ